MKKITLSLIGFIAFNFVALAQFSFPVETGPVLVAAGLPITLNINDAANAAGVPAEDYLSFSVTADWVDDNDSWSVEADLTVTTAVGSVLVDPATSGAASSGAATTLVFASDFNGIYNPVTDGTLDIVLNQSFGGSSANWSNIVVTISTVSLAPANDDCSGVIDLGTQTSPLSGTTVGATNDFNQNCLTNAGAPDIVYSIVVPVNFTLDIRQLENSYDSKHRLAYGDTCPGNTLIVCIDDPDTQQESWINNTGQDQTVYWIQSAFSTGSGTFTLEWSLTAPPICIVPSDLAAGNFTSTSAELSWTDSGAAGLYDVEFLDVTAGNTVTGTPTDLGVANPLTKTGLIEGNDYAFYVRADCGVDGVSEWAGPFNFSLNLPPSNNDCLNAIELIPGLEFTSNPIVGTNFGATGSGEIPLPGCATYDPADITGFGGDVWYSVTIPADGNLTIQTNANPTGSGGDSGMAVYSGICGSLVLVECDDDDSPDGLYSQVVIEPVDGLANQAVYVRVWEFGGNAELNFQISAYSATLSTSDFENETTFAFYPNPVKNTLTLTAQNNIEQVTVFNMLGQAVLKLAPNTTTSEVDMTTLGSGTYFAQVTINDIVKTVKVVKQ